MDRALDEVIGERQRGNIRGGRNRRQNNWPRDGARKNGRDDSTNIDTDWLHDKYEDETESRRPARSGRDRGFRNRDSPETDLIDQSARLRVDNLHYELTEEDLEDLFSQIAPLTSLSLTYDRAGRSTGTAFVTYSSIIHARTAIREFDGANAHGQPIRLSLLQPRAVNPTTGAGRIRNPFDTAVKPGRSLFDRIEEPRGRSSGARDRSRSRSPTAGRRSDVRKPPPEGVDRYVPGRLSRSRSPPRRVRNSNDRRDGGRGEGRRGDGRRDGRRAGDRGGSARDGGRPMVNGRPRMTQEELDKEMDQYWTTKGDNIDVANGNSAAAPPAQNIEIGDADIDMAE